MKYLLDVESHQSHSHSLDAWSWLIQHVRCQHENEALMICLTNDNRLSPDEVAGSFTCSYKN